jgi:nitroreductase
MFERTPESLIRERISVRRYRPDPLSAESQVHFLSALKELERGPFGNRLRFSFVSARDGDFEEMKGLGTYGVIENPRAFLIAAVIDTPSARWDFGWALELAVLKARELGWGSCWLGGNFHKGHFSARIGIQQKEIIPAVLSFGYPAKTILPEEIRHKRLPFESLFTEADGVTPLSVEAAGPFVGALELVRLAPSAVNKQPWRVSRDGKAFRFSLVPDPFLSKGLGRLFLKDKKLQSVDMGIALCHFDLGVRQAGIKGSWSVQPGSGSCFIWTAE